MSNRMTGLPNPDPRAGARAPGLFSPKVGVAGLFVCFAMVLAAFLGMGLFDSSSDDDGTGPEQPPGQLPPTEHVGEGALAALLPEDSKRAIEQELAAYFADTELPPIADDQAVDEPFVVEKLLQPKLFRRMTALPPRIYTPLANVPGALTDPSAVRGRLVRVWGKVDAVREDTLDVPGDPRTCWIVDLRDQNGVPWTLTGLDKPSEMIEAGEWVKGYGVFTKTWPHATGGAALHAFLVRRVVHSYPPVEHLEPKTEWAADIVDHANDQNDPMASELQDEAFYGMLNYVRAMGPAGYRQARDTERLQVYDLTGTNGARPLLDAPGNYRFQAVRLRLAPLHREFGVEHVGVENPGNIDLVYTGFGVDDQKNIVRLVSPFPRDEFTFDDARVVEVEGIFYKALLVEAANGRRYRMPILLMTQATPIHWKNEETDPETIVALVLAGSVLLLAVFVLLLFKNRQERAAFEERHAARRARRGSGGAGDA